MHADDTATRAESVSLEARWAASIVAIDYGVVQGRSARGLAEDIAPIA